MDVAVRALGEYKARNQHMHIGPNAHLLHYPVAGGTMINVAAFVSDPEPWTDDEKMVLPAIRSDVEAAFSKWGPSVRDITSLLPEKLDKWALFDTWDYPAPFYNRGRVCIAGDAAHASVPHHGTGACIGIEDVLCLSILVEKTIIAPKDNKTTKGQRLSIAFKTYDAVRRERSQWLVNSSRRVCDLYQQPEWADRKIWTSAEKCFGEIGDRSYKIWHFDDDGMIEEAITGYDQRMEKIGGLYGS